MKRTSVLTRSLVTAVIGGLMQSTATAEPIEVPVISSLVRTGDRTTETRYTPQLVDIPSTILDRPISADRIVTTYVDTMVSGGYPPYRGARPLATDSRYSWFPSPTSNNMTVREYLRYLGEHGLMSGTVKHEWAQSTLADVCQGFALSYSKSGDRYANTAQAAYSAAMASATFTWQPQCSELPPVASYCTLMDAEVALHYGTLLMQQATGSEVHGSLNVRCSTTTKISLGTPQGSNVTLSNGGQISLTSGGRDVGDPALNYTVEAGVTKNIPITAELTVPGRVGGFEGHTVITLRYP